MQKYYNAFQDYNDFYKEKILNNKQFTDTLFAYRWENAFIQISKILYNNEQVYIPIFILQKILRKKYKNKFESIKKKIILKNYIKQSKKVEQEFDIIKQEIYNENLVKIKKHIKNFEKMIDMSPGLPFQVKVYRGMDYDIFPEIEKKNKKYYFKSKNFLATSFDPHHSIEFAGKLCCFYTVILPKKTKGLFIFNNFEKLKNIEKISIDTEHEFLLQRNSVFEVIKQDVIENFMQDGEYTYGQQQVLKKFPINVKHYVLKYVESEPPCQKVPNIERFNKKIKYNISDKYYI